ncbi:MAG: aminotransferase class V-fold PLP-dependent enzyme [Bacillota bacterium]|jgi:cysteine desulfurase/selenocysteine lyase
MIYLDNAATSFPKPNEVWQALEDHWFNKGGNPGRSGHRLSLEAGRTVAQAREALADLFHGEKSEQVVFASNATDAINMAFRGVLKPGDHVITTSMEHNSVIRPLRDFEKYGGELTVVPCNREGFIDLDHIQEQIKRETKLVVVNHVSNLTGTIQPIEEIGCLCREKGVLFMVDAAQSAGTLPIDVKKAGISLLAFTGHKGLFGPQGTGGLYVHPGLDLAFYRLGGTGSRSDSQYHPDFMPDRLEAGTLNAFGLSGLLAGVNFIKEEGLDTIREREAFLTSRLVDGLRNIDGVEVYGPQSHEKRSCVISFNITGLDGAEVAYVLDEQFDVMTRPGIHCAPLAHETIGTFPLGTIRMSVGYFNTESDIDTAVEAVSLIAKEAR